MYPTDSPTCNTKAAAVAPIWTSSRLTRGSRQTSCNVKHGTACGNKVGCQMQPLLLCFAATAAAQAGTQERQQAGRSDHSGTMVRCDVMHPCNHFKANQEGSMELHHSLQPKTQLGVGNHHTADPVPLRTLLVVCRTLAASASRMDYKNNSA